MSAPTAPAIVDDAAVEVAQRFASVLFLLTCVMPNRDDAIALLHESAELPDSEQPAYVAYFLWPNYDDLPPCSKAKLLQVIRQAFNAADETAQRIAADAEEARGADRVAAGDLRLAAAAGLLVA